ncbi:MAG: exodeoxyribonuclease III [Bdellovibrionales bacterium]|nr:exodeoxyribonuclease III [Bdellovibrionales bacterium]
MKIITWNVNGIRSVVQKGFYEFIERENPDILCLQETKAHPDQLEDALRAPLGWNTFWSAAQRPGYSGTATWSREAPAQVTHGFGVPRFDAEGRLVVSRFKDFVLYNCYFPNGGMGPERHEFKQEFLKRFGHHLQRQVQAGENVIVVGDYNVAYLDIDVYDPKALAKETGFLPEERQWMTSFLEGGFIDGYRYFHPQEKHRYTWWAYFQNARPGNRGWRIDHICVSRSLEKRMKSVQILDQQQGSDHCPVVMEIDI